MWRFYLLLMCLQGFREVKKVNFVPRFESKREERLFLQFTSD